MKPGVMGLAGGRTRMAADLLRFAAASLGAGLLVAVAAAALVMLLAGPAYSEVGARTPPSEAAPARDGFLRLVYREGREPGDLLRHVDRALLDLCVGDELADEAYFVRLPGLEELRGEDSALGLVLADGAGAPLRVAAAGTDAEVYLGLAELRRYACNDDVARHRELTAAVTSPARGRPAPISSPRSPGRDPS